MGIVARRAAKAALALLVAPAGEHLLGVADRLRLPLRLAAIDKDGQEFLQRQPGTVVECLAADRLHPLLPAQVALLADSLAEGRFEVAGLTIVGSMPAVKIPGLRA